MPQRERFSFTSHVVNRLNDFEHLLVCDSAILVDIVQLESPCSPNDFVSALHATEHHSGLALQLLVEFTTRSDAQCANELFEVDGPAVILVCKGKVGLAEEVLC